MVLPVQFRSAAFCSQRPGGQLWRRDVLHEWPFSTQV